MEPNKVNRVAVAFGVAGFVALGASGALFFSKSRDTAPPPPAEARAVPVATTQPAAHAEAGAHAEGEGHSEEDGHGHGHGGEGSDLDRPVEELWAQKCEHNIPQFQCDECRYELGAVKLASSLFGEKGKPGLVKSMKTETRSFSAAHELTGEVQMSEGKTVHVSPPLPGMIRKVHVGLGERVSAGQPLFEVDSHEVAQTKAEYLKSLAALNLARKTAERERILFEKKISAAAEVQQAEAAKAEAEVEAANAKSRLLRLGLAPGAVAALVDHPSSDLSGVLTVRAPRSGTVLEKHAVAGEHLEPGKDVLLLSDLSEVWVWANLKETDVQAVSKAGGQLSAEVETPGAGKIYRGKVDIVSGTMDEHTRTVKARVILANAGGSLRPGMFVKVKLLLPGSKAGVAVPKVAVLADEGRPFVFVHKEGEYWIRRPVALGERSGTQVEIREGLQPGQMIVADGSFLLKSDVLKKKMGAGCAD